MTTSLPRSFSLGFSLLAAVVTAALPQAGLAQIAVPTSISGPQPTFGNATSSYSLNNNITCPTPTLNLTGFGGDTDGSASDQTQIIRSQSADVTNWGVALGVSIPLGSNELREFCRKFASAQAKFQETRTLNQDRNSTITLLQQCLYIQESLGIQVGKNAEFFRKDGPLAPFSECLDLRAVLDVANRRPSLELPAPRGSTESATPSPTPVTISQ